ncbi:hypothetical protein KXD93_29255 [Mucilaginibacter sp. BJC16-A38]|uniref:hypothetical protein n=1 Tax=Mucilaginibacter phenanthrenivorans TaxID=1234842 RepID=UPI0021587ED4|nr:hypothetical protein [Mucilaginibacter phenanthrenivorans]MCR8561780.1 hypothetical protein [Mucilaginibacter phenanthrenivorans]
MKKKIFTSTALLCCFMVCFALVADLNGKWTGTLHAPDGNDYPLNYTFKVDGDKLTGTGESPQGSTPITDGKVSGTDYSFTIDVGGVAVKNSGKLYPEADSLGMDIDYNGYKMHATLKRSDK